MTTPDKKFTPTQLHLPEGCAKMGGWGATQTQEGRLCHLHSLPGRCAAEADLSHRIILLMCEARDLAEARQNEGESMKQLQAVDGVYELDAEGCE